MRLCPNCQAPLINKQAKVLCCSRKCGAIWRRRQDGSGRQPCPCGGTTETHKAKFCRKCIDAGRHVTGRKTALAECETDRTRKAVLLLTMSRACRGCGGKTWRGSPMPLELDHVDGDSDNNSRENLRLLCPNCHAITPTYKARNRGRAGGRTAKRNKYYKTALKA